MRVAGAKREILWLCGLVVVIALFAGTRWGSVPAIPKGTLILDGTARALSALGARIAPTRRQGTLTLDGVALGDSKEAALRALGRRIADDYSIEEGSNLVFVNQDGSPEMAVSWWGRVVWVGRGMTLERDGREILKFWDREEKVRRALGKASATRRRPDGDLGDYIEYLYKEHHLSVTVWRPGPRSRRMDPEQRTDYVDTMSLDSKI